ncbi:MAG: hypothetical protein EAZ61_00495 [Oscillatoriales cyanobacterium]|nr:MAG: hypothetical protein EAZ61_00495 [Oscillatoriales cyanobacterium]
MNTANTAEMTQVLVTITTVVVVGFNMLLGLGLAIAAGWVWRSRRPVRQFARDLDRLERELRATLPEVPAQLAASCEQLRHLKDLHQVTIARVALMKQVLRLLRQLSGRLTRWRSARSARSV